MTTLLNREELIRRAARILNNTNAKVCNVNADDQWAVYSDMYVADARAIFDELFPIPTLEKETPNGN